MKNSAPSPARFVGRPSEYLWVALGGMLGTLARHGLDVLLSSKDVLHVGFPWPIFIINVSGSALLGFILAWVEESKSPPHWLRPGAGVGFCGAFTTFSTASVEILLLARSGHITLALSYLIASIVAGLLAVTIATALAVRIFQPPASSPRLRP